MARKNILNPNIDKQAFKASQGSCRICGDNDPAVLDVHRILEGAKGGKYTKLNSACLCCKCHRRVHDGQIKIVKYHMTSSGAYLLNIIENGVEKFI